MEEYTHEASEENPRDDTVHQHTSTLVAQSGQDPQGAVIARQDAGGKKKIVYLCVHGRKNYLHYAVVPLPSSYQEAKEIAIDVLGGYLGYPDITPEDIYLRYGIKRGTNIHWAYIKPAFWDQVINGGEELRIVRKVNNGADEVENEEQKALSVTFRLGKTAQASPRDKYAKMLVTAENYFETKESLLKLFTNSLKPSTKAANLKLFAVVKNQDGVWVTAVMNTTEAHWRKSLAECKKENANFEILVVELQT